MVAKPSLHPRALETLQQADLYLELGWPIVPVWWPTQTGGCGCRKPDCTDQGKHPIADLAPAGVYTPARSMATVERWLSQDRGRYTHLNLGIATGAESGIIALDVDVKAGGEESLAAAEAEHGRLPDTVMQLTGSGGAHYLFAHPGEKVENKVSLEALPGCDIRGDGGYIIVAPSRHVSGGRYYWEHSSDPATVPVAAEPAWLTAIRQQSRRRQTTGDGLHGELPDQIGAATGLGRNQTLAMIGGALRRVGLTEAQLFTTLWALNTRHCVPPLDDAEVQKVVRSMMRYHPAVREEEGDEVDHPKVRRLADLLHGRA